MKAMLQLSGSLINQPVLSLRTGGLVATITEPIINPNNLKIEGFYCKDSINRHQQLVLLVQDIRDIIPEGFVVNDHDVLAEPSELVRLQDIIKLHFQLVGKLVVTSSKERVGKVGDYATDTNTMYIQKLYAVQSVFKSFTGGSLSVDRTQIVEITDTRVVINEILRGAPARAAVPA
jgi:uncharacterized protein YrrD